jgi:hypothetical protein
MGRICVALDISKMKGWLANWKVFSKLFSGLARARIQRSGLRLVFTGFLLAGRFGTSIKSRSLNSTCVLRALLCNARALQTDAIRSAAVMKL